MNDINSFTLSGLSITVRNYEKLLTETGRRATVEGKRDIQIVEGIVAIVGTEVIPTTGTVYYLYLKDIPHLFTAGAGHSPELPVTRDGHRVRIEIYASDSDVISMHGFDNLSIQLSQSPVQAKARAADDKSRSEQEASEDARVILERLKKMDPKELQKLLKEKGK